MLATLLASIEIADSGPVERLRDVAGTSSLNKVFPLPPRGIAYQDYAMQQQGLVLHEPKLMAAAATLGVREPSACTPNRYARSV
jgi:hypothetical protein